MPELPEVEVVRAGLDEVLPGAVISKVNIFNPKSFQVSAEDTVAFVNSATILGVRRRAKILLFDLDSAHTMAIHLKMTGQLIYRSSIKEKSFAGGHPDNSLISDLPNNHTRVSFNLSHSTTKDVGNLFFNDMRKFGWIKLFPTTTLSDLPLLQKLGPEPLIGQPQKEYLARIKRRPNSKIKAALLNQEVVAGIGNIYADEALWGAKVNPETRVKDLDDSKLEEILQVAINVMALSIEKGGSTDRNYVDSKGQRGTYLEYANVFRKEGEACSRCGEIILKIRVAGRGTHICPGCQPQVSETKL